MKIWMFCSEKERTDERSGKGIPAKAVRKDGSVSDLTLYVKGLTADEKEIILRGCLMNYYAAQNK